MTVALLLAIPGGASSRELDKADPAVLFAGGGTNLSNGVFFPGTAVYDEDNDEFIVAGPPLQVDRGKKVTFVNQDATALTNVHHVQSLDFKKVKIKKKSKKGKTRKMVRWVPLFDSGPVAGPTAAEIDTSKVKPGLYYYRCLTHQGMFGALEVVE